MFNIVKKSIPKRGFLWEAIKDYFENLLDALNLEPERIRDYLLTIVRESNPGTAVSTQEEWFQQYGLKYNPTKSIVEKQSETLERYIALGGQDIVYLQGQLEKSGFTDILLLENLLPPAEESNECGVAICGEAGCWSGGGLGSSWIYYYYVIGSVDNNQELLRLKGLLQKIAPGHLIPIFSVSASDNVCNVAVCGEAICDG